MAESIADYWSLPVLSRACEPLPLPHRAHQNRFASLLLCKQKQSRFVQARASTLCLKHTSPSTGGPVYRLPGRPNARTALNLVGTKP